MDNIENTYPPFQTQRIETYLQDLYCQLRVLEQKQEDVINILMDIIKEFYEIPKPDQETNDGLENQMTRIKKRIWDFELISKDSDMFTIFNQKNVDILQTFQQLHKSAIFQKSFHTFSKVKESFEKINTFFGKLKNIKPENSDMKKYISKGIREKINSLNRIQTDFDHTTSRNRNIFSNNNVAVQTEKLLSASDSCSYYASCYGSEMSLCKLLTGNETISTLEYDDDKDVGKLDIHM